MSLLVSLFVLILTLCANGNMSPKQWVYDNGKCNICDTHMTTLTTLTTLTTPTTLTTSDAGTRLNIVKTGLVYGRY